MDSPFGSMLSTSVIFCFVVGETRKEYYVHGDIFAQLSKPLFSLLKGDFKEAKERMVYWDSVSEETFRLLCQFAYNGNYAAKDVVSELSDSGAASDVEIVVVRPVKRKREMEDAGKAADKDAGKGATKKRRVRASVKKQVVVPPMSSFGFSATLLTGEPPTPIYMNRFMLPAQMPLATSTPAQILESKRLRAEEKVTEVKANRPDLQGIELSFGRAGNRVFGSKVLKDHFVGWFPANSAEGNSGSSTNLSTATDKFAAAHETEFSLGQCLMVHARLYVLAHEKMMDSLKNLTLEKMHWILLRFQHDRVRLPILVDFARFVFDNTFGDSDELRSMIVEHFALHVERDGVGASDDFVDLIEDGGDFTRLFWKQIFWRRLH